MRRHVDNVSRARGQRCQFVSTCKGALGIGRGFDSVNVVVDGAQMIGIAPHDGLQRGYDLLGAGFGRAVRMPQSPGMQVHPRLREQRCCIEVVGKLLRNFAHGVVIRLLCFLAVCLGIGRETQCHGRNVGFFAGRGIGRKICRFLNGFVRLLEPVLAGGIVIVRSHGFGYAPICNGELGIEFGGPLE